jgi:uncharacterized protein involved in tellurium resistance
MTDTQRNSTVDEIENAVAGLENAEDGVKITNYTEYFHAKMGRVSGFGIRWAESSNLKGKSGNLA